MKRALATGLPAAESHRRRVESVGRRCIKAALLLTLACFALIAPVSGHAQTIAIAGQGISSPTYVNIYWDANWDSDSPGMTRATVDNFTNALLNSSYFAGLSEYGIGTPSLAGSFLPDVNCAQTAPARVGFYDPINPSIIGFIQCELQHASLPQGSNVIYNIMLPPQSLESDFGGAFAFCVGGNPVSWHFHGAPLFWQGTPIYTIVSAAPSCGSFINNLVHEMIEAASDPFPPGNVMLTGKGEIADICPALVTTPFNVPESSGFIPTISVPGFWSNAGQKCVTGFSNTTMPAISTPMSITGTGAAIVFAISGSGFGVLPPAFGSPVSGDVPYLAIRNATEGWEAGDSLNSDALGVNVSNWTPAEIHITGFSATSGFVIKPNDTLAISICNPSSGLCSTVTATTPAGPYLPQLIVTKSVDPATDPGRFNLLVDGKTVASDVGATSTGPQTVSVGTHAVSETAAGTTNPGNYSTSFLRDCDSTGHVTLNEGETKTCGVVNFNRSGFGGGCGAGMKCCKVQSGRCVVCMGGGQPCP